jgi:hypothetical protein
MQGKNNLSTISIGKKRQSIHHYESLVTISAARVQHKLDDRKDGEKICFICNKVTNRPGSKAEKALSLSL